VTDAAQWEKRRARTPVLIHIISRNDPAVSRNVAAASKTERREGDLPFRMYFSNSPEKRASLNVAIDYSGWKGPFPVFITQDNHYRWR
jgi:hypothetical protein